MDDPVPVPSSLLDGPTDPTPACEAECRVHAFDLDSQRVEALPAFTGLRILPDLVSRQEEDQLLARIDETPFLPSQSGRTKQHFGPRVNFNKRRMNVDGFRGLPSYAHFIEDRLRSRLRDEAPGWTGDEPGLARALASFETTDVFVLRYRADRLANHDFHQDDPFAYGEMIIDLSLESDCVLTFLRASPSEAAGFEAIRAPLPARSAAILFGSARLDWEHGILTRDISSQRTSVTLRSLSEALRGTEAGRRVVEIARTSTLA